MDVKKILNSLNGKQFTPTEVSEFVAEFYNGAGGKPTVEIFNDPAKFYSANQTVRADKNWKETYLEGEFSDKCWIEGGKKKWTVTENNEIDWKEYDIIGDVEQMLMDAFTQNKGNGSTPDGVDKESINNFGFCVGQLYTPEVGFFHKGIFCMFVYNANTTMIGGKKGKKKVIRGRQTGNIRIPLAKTDVPDTPYATSTKALVLQSPICKLDDELKLHSVKVPAIQWGGRINEHYIHGVRFDTSAWTGISSRKWTPEQVMAIQNIEQRRVACKHYGKDKIFKALSPVLIHKSDRGNELYEVSFGTDGWRRKQLILKYKDPSTTREYLSGIPRQDDQNQEIKDADQAMAWKFSLTKDEYDLLTVEG